MRRAKDATALCGLICPVDSSSLCKAAAEAEAAVRMPVGISALKVVEQDLEQHCAL